MMTVNTTLISAYSAMNAINILSTLPKTMMTLTGMITVTQTLTKSKASQFTDFPHWQYFVAEFTQHFERETKVFPLPILR